MSQLLTRFVALLLVPALAVEPGFTSHLGLRPTERQEPACSQTLLCVASPFAAQALAEHLVAIRNYANTARIGAFTMEAAIARRVQVFERHLWFRLFHHALAGISGFIRLGFDIPPYTLPRDFTFVTRSAEFLKQNGIAPRWGDSYVLEPGTVVYNLFFKFLIDELRSLPFDHEVGHPIMRFDARQVVQRLVTYLETNAETLRRENRWSGAGLEAIWSIYDGDHEVFKNEIYPSHHMNGIGYSLDIGTRGPQDRGHQIPGIRLKRYHVIPAERSVNVINNGTLELFLESGRLMLTLDQKQTANVHLERPAAQAKKSPPHDETEMTRQKLIVWGILFALLVYGLGWIFLHLELVRSLFWRMTTTLRHLSPPVLLSELVAAAAAGFDLLLSTFFTVNQNPPTARVIESDPIAAKAQEFLREILEDVAFGEFPNLSAMGVYTPQRHHGCYGCHPGLRDRTSLEAFSYSYGALTSMTLSHSLGCIQLLAASSVSRRWQTARGDLATLRRPTSASISGTDWSAFKAGRIWRSLSDSGHRAVWQ